MGAIRNKYSGDTINGVTVPSVVVTDMTVVKEGSINVMKFNSTTSKVDLGSYDTLVGDLTILADFNPYGWGEGTYGNIINNGKLVVWLNAVTGVGCQSDGATGANATAASVKMKQWNKLAITRTSTGITNFYMNGISVGTANQSSGTPAAGTTNIIVGNNNAGSATFDGLISKVRVLTGLLTANEISQEYTSNKFLYSL